MSHGRLPEVTPGFLCSIQTNSAERLIQKENCFGQSPLHNINYCQLDSLLLNRSCNKCHCGLVFVAPSMTSSAPHARRAARPCLTLTSEVTLFTLVTKTEVAVTTVSILIA